eukprot:SAG31_NODE_1320_length_8809_cov_4.243398_10_plen_313_part_00
MLWNEISRLISKGVPIEPEQQSMPGAETREPKGKSTDSDGPTTPTRQQSRRRPTPVGEASSGKFAEVEAELKLLASSSPLTPDAKMQSRASRAETALRTRRAMEMAWARQVQFRFNMLWAVRKRRVLGKVLHGKAGKHFEQPQAASNLKDMQVGDFSWASAATVSAVLDSKDSAKESVRNSFFDQMLASGFSGGAQSTGVKSSGGLLVEQGTAAFEQIELGGWRWESLAGGDALGTSTASHGLVRASSAAQLVGAATRKGNKAFGVSGRNVSLEALYFVEQRKRTDGQPSQRHVPSPEKYVPPSPLRSTPSR